MVPAMPMPTRTFSTRLVGIALLIFVLPLSARSAPVPNSEYADATLVVYNKSVPESRQLAAFYAQSRNIPIDHLVPLECSTGETISRDDYDATIATPLRQFFTDEKLWQLKEVEGGKAAVECKIHVIALMKGIPLRIAATPLPPTGKVDANGNPVPPAKDKVQTDEASVDSEMALLSLDALPTKSMGRNPFFRKQTPKKLAGIAPLMLVGRVDGPTWEHAKRLIEDAIAVEKTGLWGNAYIDLARMETRKGPGYKLGDDWLRGVANGYHHLGIPVYVDNHPERLVDNFPLGNDVILYFGWYARHLEGAFANPDFRFKRGAVAAHIHSYSATTIRDARQGWVGPLVAKGAAAVLGNVFEPFLSQTTHLDLFNARLLEGYTFIEAAWMATPSVSWMNVMVGDPLYQPFLPTRTYGKLPDPEFKAMRLAVNRWRDTPELYGKLEFAGDQMKSGKVYEAVGLRYRRDLKFDEAAAAFTKARGIFKDEGDRLRMDLLRVELLRSQDKKKEAIAALRKLLPIHQGKPGGKAVQALINQLDPPPPPPPPPPAKK